MVLGQDILPVLLISKLKMQNCNLKFKNKIDLKRAIDFHGHLGPYLVLGLLMGDLAIKKLECKKHFGIKVIVKGAFNKPKSCLIDGIQLSAGCTYGKGNIQKLASDRIEVLFRNTENNKKIAIRLNDGLIKKLTSLRGHNDSEVFAKELSRLSPTDLFNFRF